MDIFIDMKYIITEEQLRLITEQESEEDKGRMVYIIVKIPKPSHIVKNTGLGKSEIRYTPEGYPIPTKPFDGYTFAISSADRTALLYTRVENSDPSNRTMTGYEGPDGEVYVLYTRPNDEDALMHLDRSLIDHVVDSPLSEEEREEYVNMLYPIFKSGRRKKMKLTYFNKVGQNVYEREID